MFKIKLSQINFAACIVLVVTGALILRLVGLGSLPIILNPDEAAIAYNAYLLAKTGMDEWARSWPMTLQSFGDFKLIGYPAIVAGLFHYLPTSEAVVRTPAAVAGTFLVLLGASWSSFLNHSRKTQIVISVLFAVTPIFFFYSRMAFESLVALALTMTSLRLLFGQHAAKQRLMADISAFALFLLACLTYNTPLLILPLIIIAIIWWRGLLNWKTWVVPVLLLLLLFVVVLDALSSATSQKSAITIFSDPFHREQAITFSQRVPKLLAPIAKAPLYFLSQIVERVVKTFGVSFLVQRGGAHPWHSLPFWGHIYGVEYVIAIVGMCVLLLQSAELIWKTTWKLLYEPLAQQKHGAKVLLLFLTFAGLAPAVVTVDAPHATRSLVFFFCLLLLVGEGIEQLAYLSRTRQLRSLFPDTTVFVVVLSIVAVSATRYLFSYFFWFPQHHPLQLPVGFDTAIRTMAQNYPGKEIAVVDTHGTLYVYTSWYLQYAPELFFATIHKQLPTPIGLRYGERVGQFHFIAQLDDRTTEAAVLYHNGHEWSIAP